MRIICVVLLSLGSLISHAFSQGKNNDIVSETVLTDSLPIPFEQQMDSVFGLLPDSLFPSHLILDRSFPLVELSDYRGKGDPQPANADVFRRAYGTLYYAQTDIGQPVLDGPEAYEILVDSNPEHGPIPIGILAYRYHRLKPYALDSNLVSWSNGQLVRTTASPTPFKEDTVFICTPFSNSDTAGISCFTFPSALRFSNLDFSGSKFEVDFGDGSGYREMVQDSVYKISYPDNVERLISVRLRKHGLTVLTGAAGFKKQDNPWTAKGDADFIWFPEADEAFKGKKAKGKVSVFLACGHTGITKPLIVAEGFFPTEVVPDEVSPISFREKFVPFPGLRDELNLAGYDIIYLDYDAGTDFIERNALLLKKVIKEVNLKKRQNGSIEQNVVLGLSMGGLVARYALTEMELRGPAHETKLFIAFDTPNQGAYTPLGLQYMISHLNVAKVYGIPISVFAKDIKKLKEIQNRPSSQEMQVVRNHRFSHIPGIKYPPNYQYRDDFWADLLSRPNRGYPRQCRNVSISNGSQQGVGQGFNPNGKIMDIQGGNKLFVPDGWETFILRYSFGIAIYLDFDIWAMPDQPQGSRRVYRGDLGVFVFSTPIMLSRRRAALKAKQSYDMAPGGQLDLSGALGTVPLNTNIIEPLVNFVPVTSGLDILPPDSANLFYNVQNGNIVQNSKTLFQAYDAPDGLLIANPENEIHVAVTQYNADFFERELLYPNQNKPPAFLTAETYHYAEGVHTELQPIDVRQHGRLIFNRNEGIGFGASNLAPPVAGNDYIIATVPEACVSHNTIIIRNGGLMELGETSTSNKARVHIRYNSNLILDSGSTLRINQGSRLIIESGATLHIYPGARIELNGNLSRLEIDGKLVIAPGATLQFSGAGSIVYGNPYGAGAIYCHQNSKILLEGQNRSQVILYLKKKAKFEPGGTLVDFQLKQGRVVLEDSAGIAMTSTAYTLQDLDVFALNSSQVHEGIRVFGQPNHLINNIEVAGGRRGIKGELSFGGSRLKISNSLIRNCETGLEVSGKGVELEEVDFRENETGYKQAAANLYSTLRSCTLENQLTRAIEFESGGADLYLNRCTIDNNAEGVRIDGLGELRARCGSIADNSGYGIFAGPGSTVMLNDWLQVTGAQVNLTGNQSTIRLNRARDLDLRFGHNDLAPAVSMAGNILTGDLENSCGAISSLDAGENHWRGNGTGSAPVWGTDYTLFLRGQFSNQINCSSPISVTDPAPVTGNPQCIQGPGGQGGGSGMAKLAGCTGCPILNHGYYSGVRLDEAVADAMRNMTLTDDSLGNDRLAIFLFSEILGDTFLARGNEILYFREKAYRGMKAALYKAMQDQLVSTRSSDHEPLSDSSALQVLAVIQARGAKATELPVRTFFQIEEALIMRALGLRDRAISILDSIQLVCPDHYWDYLNGLTCRTRVERDILSGDLAFWEADSVLAFCEAAVNEKRSFSGTHPGQGQAKTEDNMESSLQLTVFPVPARAYVDIRVPNRELSGATIVIRNLAGKIIREYQLNQHIGIGEKARIDLNGLESGMFLVELMLGDGTAGISKLVVQQAGK